MIECRLCGHGNLVATLAPGREGLTLVCEECGYVQEVRWAKEPQVRVYGSSVVDKEQPAVRVPLVGAAVGAATK